MRLRCRFCARPVRPYWLRCPVCKTRRAAWYAVAVIIALAVLALLFLLLFWERASSERMAVADTFARHNVGPIN